jgi:hypothetical protein
LPLRDLSTIAAGSLRNWKRPLLVLCDAELHDGVQLGHSQRADVGLQNGTQFDYYLCHCETFPPLRAGSLQSWKRPLLVLWDAELQNGVQLGHCAGADLQNGTQFDYYASH